MKYRLIVPILLLLGLGGLFFLTHSPTATTSSTPNQTPTEGIRF